MEREPDSQTTVDQMIGLLQRIADGCGERATGNEVAVAIVQRMEPTLPSGRALLVAGLRAWVRGPSIPRAIVALMVAAELQLQEMEADAQTLKSSLPPPNRQENLEFIGQVLQDLANHT